MRTKVQIGLASFQFMINGRRAIFYTFLTLFMVENLGANFIEVGLVITLPMFINSTMQALVWGRLSDRIKRRRLLMIIGETSAGIGYLLLWTSISIWNIILGLTLIEAIWSMSNTGWAALFADLTKPQERSTLMGRINSLGVIGRLVGLTSIGILYDYPTPSAGFHFAFPIAALIMFISVITLVILVPETKIDSKIQEPVAASTAKIASDKLPSSYRIRFFIFLACWAIITISWTCYNSLFTVFLRNSLNLTSIEIALVMNLNAGIGLIAAPVAGYMGDILGRKFVMFEAFLIQAVTTVLYPFAGNLPAMLLVATLGGIPRQVYFTVGYALAADLIPMQSRGRLFGVYNAVWTLSFGGSPTFVGGVFASSREASYLASGYSPSASTILAISDLFFLSTGIMVVGAALFMIGVKETKNENLMEKTSNT
ncbi:MAG: MFS transporter [Promethearchaeota archaeon]